MPNAQIHELPRTRLPGEMLTEQDLRALVRLVPEHMQRELMRYVEQCQPPCGFLVYVLQNDLASAAANADSENARRLCDMVRWLNCHAPQACWGSKAKVRRWLGRRGRR